MLGVSASVQVQECAANSSESIYKKRSQCCKHRFSLEHTAVVATSLRFTACELSSVLFQKGFPTEFSHLNQTTLLSLWLWGWILAHALHFCSCTISALCCTVGLGSISKQSTSDPPEVSENPLMYRNDISLHCKYQSQPASFCLTAPYYQTVRNVSFFNAAGQV